MNNTNTNDSKHPRQPRGYWVETSANGEKLFCYAKKTHGKKVEYKFTLKEIVEALSVDLFAENKL